MYVYALGTGLFAPGELMPHEKESPKAEEKPAPVKPEIVKKRRR